MKRQFYFITSLIVPLLVLNACHDTAQVTTSHQAATSQFVVKEDAFKSKQNKTNFNSFNGFYVHPPRPASCEAPDGKTFHFPISFVGSYNENNNAYEADITPGDEINSIPFVFNGRYGYDLGKIEFGKISLEKTDNVPVYHDPNFEYCSDTSACDSGFICQENLIKNQAKVCLKPSSLTFQTEVSYNENPIEKVHIEFLIDVSAATDYAQSLAKKSKNLTITSVTQNIISAFQNLNHNNISVSGNIFGTPTAFGINSIQNDKLTTVFNDPSNEKLTNNEISTSNSGYETTNLKALNTIVDQLIGKNSTAKDKQKVIVLLTSSTATGKINFTKLKDKLVKNKIRLIVLHVDSPLHKLEDLSVTDFDTIKSLNTFNNIDPKNNKECGNSDECLADETCRKTLGGSPSANSYCLPKYNTETRTTGPSTVFSDLTCLAGGDYYYVNNLSELLRGAYVKPIAHGLTGRHYFTANLNNVADSDKQQNNFIRLDGELYLQTPGAPTKVDFTRFQVDPSSSSDKVSQDNRFVIRIK